LVSNSNQQGHAVSGTGSSWPVQEFADMRSDVVRLKSDGAEQKAMTSSLGDRFTAVEREMHTFNQLGKWFLRLLVAGGVSGGSLWGYLSQGGP
jgi:hypothetical protein